MVSGRAGSDITVVVLNNIVSSVSQNANVMLASFKINNVLCDK